MLRIGGVPVGVVVALLAMSLAGPVAATVTPAAGSKPTPVEVVPSTLPEGGPLDVVHLGMADTDGSVRPAIVRPGTEPIALPGSPNHLLRAKGGYLTELTTAGERRPRVTFISDTGAVHRMGRMRFLTTVVVSRNGRRVATVDEKSRDGRLRTLTVTVRRVPDGKRVARRDFTTRHWYMTVVAMDGRRVWLHQEAGLRARTLRWDLVNNRVSVFSKRRSNAGGFESESAVPGASLSSGQIAVRERHHNRVVKLGHGPTWRTTRFEHVHSWSPDDRLVLTIDGVKDGGFGYHEPVAQRLRVRDARTGRLVAIFDGIFVVDFVLRRTPHWESDNTLVLVAYDRWGWDVDDGPVPEGRDRIRCNVTTASCRTVPGGTPRPWSDDIVVRRD